MRASKRSRGAHNEVEGGSWSPGGRNERGTRVGPRVTWPVGVGLRNEVGDAEARRDAAGCERKGAGSFGTRPRVLASRGHPKGYFRGLGDVHGVDDVAYAKGGRKPRRDVEGEAVACRDEVGLLEHEVGGLDEVEGRRWSPGGRTRGGRGPRVTWRSEMPRGPGTSRGRRRRSGRRLDDVEGSGTERGVPKRGSTHESDSRVPWCSKMGAGACFLEVAGGFTKEGVCS